MKSSDTCCAGCNEPVNESNDDASCKDNCCGQNSQPNDDASCKDNCCDQSCQDDDVIECSIQKSKDYSVSNCCGPDGADADSCCDITGKVQEETCKGGCCGSSEMGRQHDGSKDDGVSVPNRPVDRASGCCRPTQVKTSSEASGCCSGDVTSGIGLEKESACTSGCCESVKQPGQDEAEANRCTDKCCKEEGANVEDNSCKPTECTKGCCEGDAVKPFLTKVCCAPAKNTENALDPGLGNEGACMSGCCEPLQPSSAGEVGATIECKDSCCEEEDNRSKSTDCTKGCCEGDVSKPLLTKDCCAPKNAFTSGCCKPNTEDAENNCCNPDSGVDSHSVENPTCCSPKAVAQSNLLSLGGNNRIENTGDCCKKSPNTKTGACPCCIEDIVRTATLRRLEKSVEALNICSNVLRKCCAILDQCCRNACCFLDTPPSRFHSYSSQPQRACDVPVKEELNRVFAPDGQVIGKKAGSVLLQMEVRGMDCADCIPKVARVLARLPSVTAVEIDYFSGSAQLRYDPETISNDSIVSFLARGTGFYVKDVTGTGNVENQTHFTLPVSFPKRPPNAVFDKYDVVKVSDTIWNVSFRIVGDKSLYPREVLADLEQYSGKLTQDESQSKRDPATRDLWDLLLRTALCIVFTVPVLVLAWAPLKPLPAVHGGLQVGFATLVQILAAPMYSQCIRSILFFHIVDMNVLAVVSTSIAYVFSIVAYASEVAGNSFSAPLFETSTLLVTLIFMGRTVQAATRKSAGSAIRALHKLQDKEVTILEGEVPKVIDSRLLHYGDIIQVNPGSRIVTDGVIVSGMSDVDESSVTGESAAVSKFTGNLVIAGTINLTGTLRIQVTRLLHENSLSRITQLIKTAQSSRAPLQNLADRFSAIILPVAFTVACVALIIWILVDIFVRKQGRTDASVDGLMKAIAVLVVSCPCAIGLAVPMVIAVSMLVLSRNGILVRSADMLHLGKRITVVAFDKTGTLSQGKFTVEKSDVFIAGSERVIYELVKDDSHPIAQGVRRCLEARISFDKEKELFEFDELEVLPGKGMRAVLDGYEVLGGKPGYTGCASNPIVAEYLSSGLSLFTVTLAGTCLAVFGLADQPRTESQALIKTLRNMGKKTVILSGDNEAAVTQFATRIGVDSSDAHFSCTPEDKQAFITALRTKGEVVLFVGDGTNDGPALATADASLAIASGSEVASTSAGAVLLHSDIHRGITLLFDIAKAADRRMKISLVWCGIYMVAAILLASGAAVDFSIEARWAGLGELISVLPVVLVGFSMHFV